MIPLPSPLQELVEHLSKHGVMPVLVGGFVRDFFTGHKTLDLDIELYGSNDPETVEALLQPFGKVNAVGKSFGVLKLTYEGYHIDFSPPRLETKNGTGHKGFDITCLETIDYAEAARRRDFTINSIGYDPLSKTFLDPYGGIEDIRRKRLACVDPSTFVEDPLRVLRAVQFAARFDLSCDPNLIELCRLMVADGALGELPKERIFEELKKLFLLSPRPSIGLKLLKEIEALPFFTPLDRFESTFQDPDSHPENDVWSHILMCIDEMAIRRSGDAKRDLALMYAALLHDIAKPFTTLIENGKLNAPRHAEEGVPIAREWLDRITGDKSLIDAILPLVRYHGWPRKLFRNQAPDSDILRLSRHVCIEDLILVAEADFFGRLFTGPRPETFEAGEWLYRQAERLGVLRKPLPPLLMGRDLIGLGLAPSETFKNILESAYDAQLNGEFSTHQEALEWTKKHLVTEL